MMITEIGCIWLPIALGSPLFRTPYCSASGRLDSVRGAGDDEPGGGSRAENVEAPLRGFQVAIKEQRTCWCGYVMALIGSNYPRLQKTALPDAYIEPANSKLFSLSALTTASHLPVSICNVSIVILSPFLLGRP
jgi:hypothetical protein